MADVPNDDPTNLPTSQNPSQQVPYQRVNRNRYGVSTKLLGKGSLMVAKYDFFKHDPYPLILVTSLYKDGRVAGVNLHYLTFRYLTYLVKNYCDNRAFGYPIIKGDQYIVQAFRTYKKQGLRQAKLLDKDFFLNAMGIARSYSPSEIEKIRQSIQQQLRQQVNPKSDDMVNRYGREFVKGFQPQADYGHGRNTKGDARFNPASLPGIPPTPLPPASQPGT